MRFPYELLPGCSTRSHTAVYLQSIAGTMPLLFLLSLLFSSLSLLPPPPPPLLLLLLLLLISLLSFFVSIFYFYSHHSYSFFFLILFSFHVSPQTNDGWILPPSLRYPRIPFPRAMNLLSMILFSRRLHAPDENLRVLSREQSSVIVRWLSTPRLVTEF